jgi:hypothetical protein
MSGIESPEREDFDDGKARVEIHVRCQEAFHHGGKETQRRSFRAVLFILFSPCLSVSVVSNWFDSP